MANNKKETKTLFNSSENSNFILNMTEEQYSKLASIGLTATCFLVFVFTAIAEIISAVSGSSSYSIAAAGLSIAGVFCMILALIALIKHYIGKNVLVPVCALAVFLAWSVISLLNSYDKSVSLYGFSQRGEGVLSTLFYLGFFITAASVKREKALRSLLDGITAAGLLNAVWGILQIFVPKLGHYKFLSLSIRANAASGLSQSPVFLAITLTFSMTAALIGAVCCQNKKRRIFFIVTAALCSFTMMFTYSFIGICGLILTIIAALISVILTKAPKIRLLSVLAVIIPAMLPVLLVNCGAIGNLSSYKLYDGRIVWWADSYMRISAGSDVNTDTINLDSGLDVYLYMNDKTVKLMKNSPLTGTGPEQLAYPQITTFNGLSPESDISDVIVTNKNIFDKCYNEYLYIAATRGIPSLIALIAAVVSILFIGLKKIRQQRSGVALAIFLITLSGALMFLISCSSIAFAPIFWAAAGASCASYTDTPKNSKTE